MDVKERRLRVRLTPMQTVSELIPETNMSYIDERKFEALNAPVSQSSLTFSECGVRCLTALERLFQPRCDLNCLNARLRRDAGIDEHDLERAAVTRAPLIR